MSHEHIPTLDLSMIYDGDQGIDIVAKQIKSVFKEYGFAYLTQHGIDHTLMQQLLAKTKEFHDLPKDAKMKIKQNKQFRGYLPANLSKIQTSTQGTAKKPNLNEAFIMMFEADESHPDYATGDYLAGPNQWPDEMPELKQIMITYSKAMLKLSNLLVKAFAVAFGLQQDSLDYLFEDPTFFLRLHKYPPQPNREENQFGVAPHTDIGFMTYVMQDNVGGLQVKKPGTEDWVDVPYIENSFILNAGDMLHHLTNGVYPSAIHRVLNFTDKDRYSIPFFFDPNMHQTITPLPEFTKDKAAKFPPLLYGDYVMKRVTANYSALQDPEK